MAISVTNIGTGTGTGSAAIAVPAGGVPSGALICLASCEQGAGAMGVGTVADTVNTYSSALSQLGSGSLETGTIFFVPNASALTSSNTITFTCHTNTNFAAASAFYATGVLTTSPQDTAVSASAAVASASPTITSGTPAVAGELFVAAIAYRSSTTFTEDTTNGWAVPFNQVNVTTTAVAGGNQVNAAVSAKTFNPTLGASANGAILVVGFKPPAVVGGASSHGYIFG